MDLKEIQSLIKFVAKSGASEVSLETEDVKITIKTGGQISPSPFRRFSLLQQLPLQQHRHPWQQLRHPPQLRQHRPPNRKKTTSKYVTIKSPMIGTFYRTTFSGQAHLCQCRR